MAYVDIAQSWRNTQSPQRAHTGVVLIWNDVVYGWKDRLRDPHHERPGAIAVDVSGNVFITQGGNDCSGAFS